MVLGETGGVGIPDTCHLFHKIFQDNGMGWVVGAWSGACRIDLHFTEKGGRGFRRAAAAGSGRGKRLGGKGLGRWMSPWFYGGALSGAASASDLCVVVEQVSVWARRAGSNR